VEVLSFSGIATQDNYYDLFELGIFFSTVGSLPRNLKILPKKDRFTNELKQ
jgi:hypothetical protein